MQYIKIGKYKWHYMKCIRNLLALFCGLGLYVLFIKAFLDALLVEIGG